MSDDERPLRESVEKWLNDSGIPLEFRVAEAFRGGNMQVASQAYIDDPLTGARREVDVLAELARNIPIAGPLNEGDVPASLFVSTVVECKDHQNPWVLFGRPEDDANHGAEQNENLEEDRHASCSNTIGSLLGRAGLWHLAANGRCLDLPMFQPGPRLAHGGAMAFRKPGKKDEFYDAVQQAVSSAVALVQERFDSMFWRCPSMAVVALPAIVVSRPLFYSHLVPGREHMTAQEVTRIRLVWSGSKVWSPFVPNIDIVHASALGDFVVERSKESREILDLLAPAVQDVAQAMRTRNLRDLGVPVPWKHPRRLPQLLQNPRHFQNPDFSPRPPE